MNTGLNREDFKLYMCTIHLKWWQKILQKLHIKNYYKEVKPLTSADIRKIIDKGSK